MANAVAGNSDRRWAIDILPDVAADNHLLPRQLLSTARTVVVFFLPFTRDLADGNAEGIRRHRCDARIQVNRKRFAARPHIGA